MNPQPKPTPYDRFHRVSLGRLTEPINVIHYSWLRLLAVPLLLSLLTTCSHAQSGVLSIREVEDGSWSLTDSWTNWQNELNIGATATPHPDATMVHIGLFENQSVSIPHSTAASVSNLTLGIPQTTSGTLTINSGGSLAVSGAVRVEQGTLDLQSGSTLTAERISIFGAGALLNSQSQLTSQISVSAGGEAILKGGWTGSPNSGEGITLDGEAKLTLDGINSGAIDIQRYEAPLGAGPARLDVVGGQLSGTLQVRHKTDLHWTGGEIKLDSLTIDSGQTLSLNQNGVVTSVVNVGDLTIGQDSRLNFTQLPGTVTGLELETLVVNENGHLFIDFDGHEPTESFVWGLRLPESQENELRDLITHSRISSDWTGAGVHVFDGYAHYGAGAHAVPEPGTIGLLAVIGGYGLYRRRRAAV